MAEELGLSQGGVSLYERGARHPKRENAARIATALGADPREALEALMADTPGLRDLPSTLPTRADGIAKLQALTEEQYNSLALPYLEALIKVSQS